MSLSSIERKPPPFFRQGLPALTQLVLFAALAIFLMAADTRLKLAGPLRAVVATALLPVQQTLLVPVHLAQDMGAYMQGFTAALKATDASRLQLLTQSAQLVRAAQLESENTHLRALLQLRPALQVRSLTAEVMYAAPDPYSRKLFIDRGVHHGVRAGAPVINESGVLGQVTHVNPLTAEVTLLTDRDAAIPVLNMRTQHRAAAFGGVAGGGLMELRFVAANADVQVGDQLTTSGVDGVYPGSLLVGRVSKVERRSDAGFARILVTPASTQDNVHHVLVLEAVSEQFPAPMGPAALAPSAQTRAAKGAAARSSGPPLAAAAAASAAPRAVVPTAPAPAGPPKERAP